MQDNVIMLNPFTKHAAPVPPGPGRQAKIDNVLANSAHAPGGKYHTKPESKPVEPTPEMVGSTGLTRDKYDGLSEQAQRAINPSAFGQAAPEFNNPYTQRVAGGGSVTMPTALAGATVGNVGQNDPAVQEYHAGTNPAPTQVAETPSDPNDVFRPPLGPEQKPRFDLSGVGPTDVSRGLVTPSDTLPSYFPNLSYNPWNPYTSYDPLTQWQQPQQV